MYSAVCGTLQQITCRSDYSLARSKHETCGSELAREEAGTSVYISEGGSIAFASKVERHPGAPTGFVFTARQRGVEDGAGLPTGQHTLESSWLIGTTT
jgi:hypothetical protein